MPFQSEKQRKYLWANEPEIAREWTDKYGSRVKKDNGGIMDAWGRQGLRYPQSQDLEAQASGMFKEEDEDGNWFDRMRRWGGPIYNAYKGNTLGAIVGAAGGLPGMALGAFFGGRNLKNSAAYRPATKGAYGYSPAQLNRMNALGGHYSEPARQQRQTVNRVNNMMARKAAGKSYSKPNLSNLSAQISRGRDPSQGNTVTGHGKSGMGRDPSDRMAQGGLASLWQR
jgi:hypothetical protein